LLTADQIRGCSHFFLKRSHKAFSGAIHCTSATDTNLPNIGAVAFPAGAGASQAADLKYAVYSHSFLRGPEVNIEVHKSSWNSPSVYIHSSTF
jgi:hypothetical protein